MMQNAAKFWQTQNETLLYVIKNLDHRSIIKRDNFLLERHLKIQYLITCILSVFKSTFKFWRTLISSHLQGWQHCKKTLLHGRHFWAVRAVPLLSTCGTYHLQAMQSIMTDTLDCSDLLTSLSDLQSGLPMTQLACMLKRS